MNAPTAKPSWRSRVIGGLFERVLIQIDAGLVAGKVEVFLPDGGYRVLGGRGPGPSCTVILRRWRALARLGASGSVGWYEGWAAGDWASPEPVPLFDLFMRNRVSLGRAARAKGL